MTFISAILGIKLYNCSNSNFSFFTKGDVTQSNNSVNITDTNTGNIITGKNNNYLLSRIIL